MLSQARPSVVTCAKAGVVGKSEPIKTTKKQNRIEFSSKVVY
jgi:hypothetical protein